MAATSPSARARRRYARTPLLLAISLWALTCGLPRLASATTITWTGAVGNSWQSPGNWDLNRVPGAGDDVIINDLPATSLVTYSSGNTGVNSVTCAEDFSLSGGTLLVVAASSFQKSLALGGTLGGSGDVAISGAFNWQAGGTMSGSGTTTITAGTTWAIGGNVPRTLSRPLDNDGACTRSGNSASAFSLTGAGAFRNRGGGTFEIQGTATTSGGTFDNQVGGVVIRSTSSGTATMSSTFTNSGTVRVLTGTLQLTGTFSSFATQTLSDGTYDLTGLLKFNAADVRTIAATVILGGAGAGIVDQAGADALANLTTIGSTGSLTVKNGRALITAQALANAGAVTIGPGVTSALTAAAGYTQSAGQTVLDGGTLAAAAGVNIQGGTLSGSGTVTGNVSNGGTLSPGASPGAIAITGNYTQGAGGQLTMEVGGLVSGSQHDALAVSGTASLNGGLTVTLINGFVPAPGDSVSLVTFASSSGAFASDNLPLAVGDDCFDLIARPTAIRVKALDGVSIVQQPAGGTGCLGGGYSFSVTTAGPVLGYQWRKAGVNIVGATASSYTDASLSLADSGTYDVVITGNCGPITSNPAGLTVLAECRDTLYVDASVPVSGNGQSWAAAFKELRDALAAAAAAWTTDHVASDIWVADGVYRPGLVGNRSATFSPPTNSRLYGGFAGGETSLAARNPAVHLSILDGDLAGDDVGFINNGENSYRVVSVSGVQGVVLDGFTIRGGNANVSPNDSGGGLYAFNALLVAITVHGCTFTRNSATTGGGLRITGTAPIDSCRILDNQATTGGGCALSPGASQGVAFLTRCTISGNVAVTGGGVYGMSPVLDRCVISGNLATGSLALGGGGGGYLAGSPTVVDCDFTGNSQVFTGTGPAAESSGGGGLRLNAATGTTLTRCRFIGNTSNTGGGGLYEFSGYGTRIQACRFIGNTAQGDGGGARLVGYELEPDAPRLVDSFFSANAAADSAGAIYFGSGQPWLLNCTIARNSAGSGVGGLCYAHSSGAIRNSILWANRVGLVTNLDAQFWAPPLAQPSINYSDIMGWTSLNASGIFGLDPHFIDLDGLDNTIGTADDDPTLFPDSPAVDHGSNTEREIESYGFDVDGAPRYFNVTCVPDAGEGAPPIVDIGATESQYPCVSAGDPGLGPVAGLVLTLAGNPVRGSALVRFELPHPGRVTLQLFDVSGRRVADALDGEILPAGRHERTIDTTRLGAGIYFVRLTMGNQSVVQRMATRGNQSTGP